MPSRHLFAICDPKTLPKETTPTPILEAGGVSPTPSTAGKRAKKATGPKGGADSSLLAASSSTALASAKGGGISSLDKQFSDLASLGAASIGSLRSHQPATGARSGNLALLAEELGVGQKRDRLGGSIAGEEKNGSGSSPTLTDMLFNRGESSLNAIAPPPPAVTTAENGAKSASEDKKPAGNEKEEDPSRRSGTPGTRHLLAYAGALAEKKSEQPLHTCIAGLMGGSTTKKQALNNSLVGKGMTVGDTLWYRHHPHALSAVIFPGVRRGEGGGEQDSSTTSASVQSSASIMSSQKIAGFAIDGTLFDSKVFDRGSNAFEISHPAIPELMSSLHSSGYRIVLFASYPSLHHASAFALQEKTERIVKFFRKHLGKGGEGGGALPSVTAVLSTVSSFLADSPFHMPREGLWQYFIKHHNRGVEPNSEVSFFCGNLYDRERWAVKIGANQSTTTAEKKSEAEGRTTDDPEEPSRWTYHSENQDAAGESALVEWDVDRSFAEACGLRFVPAEDFHKGKGIGVSGAGSQ